MPRKPRKTEPRPDPPLERPPVAYTSEGGGVVGTCSACDWCRWEPTRAAAESAAAGHKSCLVGNVALVTRRRRSEQTRRIYNL
jgi:hypothetical protein